MSTEGPCLSPWLHVRLEHRGRQCPFGDGDHMPFSSEEVPHPEIHGQGTESWDERILPSHWCSGREEERKPCRGEARVVTLSVGEARCGFKDAFSLGGFRGWSVGGTVLLLEAQRGPRGRGRCSNPSPLSSTQAHVSLLHTTRGARHVGHSPSWMPVKAGELVQNLGSEFPSHAQEEKWFRSWTSQLPRRTRSTGLSPLYLALSQHLYFYICLLL